MAAIDSQTWTRKGKVSATRRTFKTPGEALKQARFWQDAGKRVALSTEHFRNPRTGERFRLYTVTMRPVPTWERHAQEQEGYGIA